MSHRAQHFIPRFLLNHFCDDSGNIYVLDMKTAALRQQKPGRVAVVNNLYDLKDGPPDPKYVEKLLSRIESSVAPIVKKMVGARSVSMLSRGEHLEVAHFTAIQLARIHWIRSYFDHIKDRPNRMLLDAKGIRLQGKVGPWQFPEHNFISLLKHSQLHFTAALFRMVPVLLAVPEDGDIPFCLSDSPVVIYNSIETRLGQNLARRLRSMYPPFDEISDVRAHLEGLISQEGAEVYLPLSSKSCIVFLDWRAASIAKLRPCETIEISQGEVRMLNWLQLISARRFVCGSSSDFRIVADGAFTDESVRIIEAMKTHFIEWNWLLRVCNARRKDDKDDFSWERDLLPFLSAELRTSKDSE